MAYLEIKNLNYAYPDQEEYALKNINLSMEKGEILFIVGKSGSGKSTFVKCISGAVPNFYGGKIAGEVSLNKKNISEMDNRDRGREVTMVFQDPERQLMMNKVHREVAFGLENIGVESTKIKRRVFESLQFSNLMDLAYRDIDTLSGGQKQKVAIASAISYLPKCIILDEPTSQLDPASAEEVVTLIKKINEELGISIIITEQRVNRWFQIADKIAVMKAGEIIFQGSRKEIYGVEDDYLFDYLPMGLKLMKKIGINKMPESFKEARTLLGEFKFDFKSEKDDHNSNADITVRKLNCKYGNISAIKDMDLQINKGDFVGILGANGAGKSTFLKSIMGLVDYSGSIKIGDKEAKKLKLKDISRIIGYVSQNPNDYISKDTVYEELKFTLDNFKINNYEIIDETLRQLGILELKHRNPRDISGGERQRVALASILVLKQKILLLDEPTRGLDTNAKKNLGKLLSSLKASGTTILLITHDVEFACEFCNRFLLMFNGEIAGDGSREEVLSESIYYTTDISKLLRDRNSNIFTLSDALNGVEKNI